MIRRAFACLLISVLVSRAGAQGSLTGYVRDEATLRGLPGVEVAVAGTDHKTKTDKEGRYTLKDILPGVQRISVRAVGFAPADTALAFSAEKATENVFFLAKAAVGLDTVKTNERAHVAGPGFASFAERKAKGFGEFLDSTFLRANDHRRLPDLLANLKGVQIVTPYTCRWEHPQLCDWRVAATKRTTQATCTLQIVLDGTVVQQTELIEDRYAYTGETTPPPAMLRAYRDKLMDSWQKTFDLNQVSVPSLIGVEVYRAGNEAPDVYGGAATNCGVIVLWTHR